MGKKPVVWYVDDLPTNLENFKKNHCQAFNIKTFSSPNQVVAELTTSKPDALLCDIFFYDSVEAA
jgi:PleD family two-component response regulator